MTDLTDAFRELVIETPSWGYGDSGTRFGVFPQPGRYSLGHNGVYR